MIDFMNAEPAPAPAGIVDASIMAAAAADTGTATGQDAPGAAPGAAPILDYGKEAADLVEFANAIYTPLWPSLSTVYTDEVRSKIAAAVAPVLQKYGFSLGDFFGKWAPEIGLAVTLAPLIPPTLAAIRADRAVRENPAPNNIQAAPHDKQTNTNNGAQSYTQGEPPAAGNGLLDRLAATEEQNRTRPN